MEPDEFSLELAKELRESFAASAPGSYPALVAVNLFRTKLDANRARGPAGPEPVHAVWDAYHGAIQDALHRCVQQFGIALLLDVHGQSHRAGVTEVGYLLTSEDLLLSDTELDANPPRPSSLDALVRMPASPGLAALVRGGSSIGAQLCRAGFQCTPSDRHPQPVSRELLQGGPPMLDAGGMPNVSTYFWGGYTTRRYGVPRSIPDHFQPLPKEPWTEQIAVIQLENEVRVREDPAVRATYAAALRDAVLHLLSIHGIKPSHAPL